MHVKGKVDKQKGTKGVFFTEVLDIDRIDQKLAWQLTVWLSGPHSCEFYAFNKRILVAEYWHDNGLVMGKFNLRQ